MSNCDDIRLFCNGYYAEIMVMDPFSLEVIFSLSSKVKPDWISALHVINNRFDQIDSKMKVFSGVKTIKKEGRCCIGDHNNWNS